MRDIYRLAKIHSPPCAYSPVHHVNHVRRVRDLHIHLRPVRVAARHHPSRPAGCRGRRAGRYRVHRQRGAGHHLAGGALDERRNQVCREQFHRFGRRRIARVRLPALLGKQQAGRGWQEDAVEPRFKYHLLGASVPLMRIGWRHVTGWFAGRMNSGVAR